MDRTELLCLAILAFDKLVQAEVERSDDGADAPPCGDAEQSIIDALVRLLGEQVPLSVEKEDYIIETYLLSADVRRIVAGDDVGMVSLSELLECQRRRFLGKRARDA